MRRTIELSGGPVNWDLLRNETEFLYRNIGDQQRAVLGVGVHASIPEPTFNEQGRVEDWVFGAMRYEWKDQLEPALGGRNGSASSVYYSWSIPQRVVEWANGSVYLHVFPDDEKPALIWAAELLDGPKVDPPPQRLAWQERCPKDTYLEHIERLMRHIQRGDIYEVNFCTTRDRHAPGFDIHAAFARCFAASKAPFAAFYRSGHEVAICASPERYLGFTDGKVIGQPMKGTRPRAADPEEDARLARELASDEKERSENIMALDVMRNDLSRIARSGSVSVDGLCTIVSLPRVHQMISTVSAQLDHGKTPMDAIKASFPMASMTGAPKIRAMELIAEAEGSPRGLFSGSLGFFAPDGTGDFNVVIRTILYDMHTELASITTGSAITALCDPEREWEECQLKARSIIDALGDA